MDSEVSPVCCKTPLHRHKFSNWCTVLERFSFYQLLFFSCVRLISFLVVSAKMSGWKICRIKLHRRPRKEIRISAQVWFQAVNGLCLAEFKQWPSGQMGDKFSPIFRSLRLAARHVESIIYSCLLGDKSDALRLDEKRYGGTKQQNNERLAKIWNLSNVKLKTRNGKLQFPVFHEKPDAKGL